MAARATRKDPDRAVLAVQVELTGGRDEARPERVAAYAFGPDGRFLSQADVSTGKGELTIPAKVPPEDVRVYLGAPTGGAQAPRVDTLRRKGAVLASFDGKVSRAIVDHPDWRQWLTCACTVRGQVVKQVTLADGSVVNRPVCKTRVHIFEVDPWWLLLQRLPEADLFRLRDDILDKLRVAPPVGPHRPVPPEPPEEHLEQAQVRMQMVAHEHLDAAPALSPSPSFDVRALELAPGAAAVRQQLVTLAPDIRWWLCWWPWLDPWFLYSVDEVAVVDTDDDGYFSTTLYYPCAGDHPDLYFQVEQYDGSAWHWIYRPPVRCNIHWNYPCGSFVTLAVTDPSARTCEQGVPIEPPGGLGTTWVMPLGIGGLMNRGYAGTDDPSATGWVRTDGLQEDGLPAADPYHGVPFGKTLSLRLAYEVDIPTPAITYYRLSCRRRGTTAWTHLSAPVVRYYEKHVPGHLFPSFPTESMGPNSVAGQANLFRFRPHAAPAPLASDPPGTTTNWPAENFFGDIYHGFLDTAALELPMGASATYGDYELGLELFSDAGASVVLSGGAVTMIFPDHEDSQGTIFARAAAGADFDAAGVLVFPLAVDNRPCEASIGAPTAGGQTADQCGMLHHGAHGDVGMSFHAWRPGGRATFGFGLTRGLGHGTLASTSGTVGAASTASGDPLHPWSSNGSGDFADLFPAGDLLDTCPQAAFAANLNVYAKVTNGFGRFNDYDAGATIAFALVH